MPTLAIVVPEYRTAVARGGGLAAVADFVATTFSGAHVPHEDRWDIRIVSPRMHHRAPEHASVLRPATMRRGPVARRRQGTTLEIWDVGTTMPEIEANRYRPRRALTDLVNECDAAIVIAGTPAIGNVMRDVRVPWILKVATVVEEERAARLATTWGARGALLRLATRSTRRLDHRALTLPEAIVTMNDSMSALIRDRTDRPVHLLATGVDVDAFQPAQRRDAGGPILMVSRLNDPRKDVATLVRAYEIARRVHGVRNELVLAGRHALPTEDHDLIGELGLAEHVRVVESPSDTRLAELLRSASVFALASREEGLGVVFLEAMASGLPIVTTATRGARYAVPANVGRLVPLDTDTVPEFAAALEDVVQDRSGSDRRGEVARAHVVAEFATEVVERRWRSLLDDVVGAAR
ncbi:glycosyltransferase family 4 protein [Curtobacterium sp. RRHDQ66]|uniref:glycosyltransferase family 4 protein n=1 Tax=Curtobacterium guangdongense TaxID=3413380 RepID=UPI003BF191B1